jgi:hypothetical protein
MHGNKSIGHRYGRAYGEYKIDVSRWIIGWIIGREIYQDEVLMTDERHKGDNSYAGRKVSLPSGSPTDVWAAARLDRLVSYEMEKYDRTRPASLSSWPTLDPIRHPTEGTYRREDITQIDLANLDMSKAPGGFFATFHAYPYYPDFMSEQPDYLNYSDSAGPNSYLGYLNDLKRHFSKSPLIIGEFGVPSSWGNAHFAQSGMNHGGHTEEKQGEYNGRLLADIYAAGCGGGALFAWMDEWWKRTWIVDELAFPRDRYMFWHNMTSPEQNFGLLSFEPPNASISAYPGFSPSGRVTGLGAGHDVAYFHLEIDLSTPLGQGETLTVGLDTYRVDLGESILPCGQSTGNRAELALSFSPGGQGQLYVTEAYDLFGIWHWASDDKQLYHSIPTDGAPWKPVRWMNNDAHHSDDWKYQFPDTIQEIGKVGVRGPGAVATSLDAVEFDGNRVKIRLPWTLLQFSDPSTGRVIDDDRATLTFRESAVSDGIAVSICLGGTVVNTGRYSWAGWDKAPDTTEREKPSMEIFAQAVKSLPDFVK